jgi:lipid-A-disaccharide synthase-like uncharacterized protein
MIFKEMREFRSLMQKLPPEPRKQAARETNRVVFTYLGCFIGLTFISYALVTHDKVSVLFYKISGTVSVPLYFLGLWFLEKRTCRRVLKKYAGKGKSDESTVNGGLKEKNAD